MFKTHVNESSRSEFKQLSFYVQTIVQNFLEYVSNVSELLGSKWSKDMIIKM